MLHYSTKQLSKIKKDKRLKKYSYEFHKNGEMRSHKAIVYSTSLMSAISQAKVMCRSKNVFNLKLIK